MSVAYSCLNECSSSKNGAKLGIGSPRSDPSMNLISVTTQMHVSQLQAVMQCEKSQAGSIYRHLCEDVGGLIPVAKRVHSGLRCAIDYWEIEIQAAKGIFFRADCTCFDDSPYTSHPVSQCEKSQAERIYRNLWNDVGGLIPVAKGAHAGLQRAIDYWAIEVEVAKNIFFRADCTCFDASPDASPIDIDEDSQSSLSSSSTLSFGGAHWASDTANLDDTATPDSDDSVKTSRQ